MLAFAYFSPAYCTKVMRTLYVGIIAVVTANNQNEKYIFCRLTNFHQVLCIKYLHYMCLILC